MKCVYIPRDVPECGKAFLRDKGYEIRIGTAYDEETMKRDVVGADAILARTAPFTRDVIMAGDRLKVIARFGVGYETIDIDAATEHGVYVTIAKNANQRAVAEHTFSLILALSKGIVPKYEACKSGDWDIRNRMTSIELCGKTIGIIGFGNIGKDVAKIGALGFDMNVLAYNHRIHPDTPRYVKMVSLEEVLRESDFVTLHVPVTDETRGMINKCTLAMMKKNAVIINVDRGSVVNEDDLYEALSNGTIAACGSDTFIKEPVDPNNKLLSLPNFLASPHCGGLTKEASDKMCMIAAESIDDVLNGRTPKYPVNEPKIYSSIKN